MMELKVKFYWRYRTVIPPGHNAWVVGNESCVMIDFTGAKDYAKNS